eukprot:425372-Rhodomonas_salina.3
MRVPDIVQHTLCKYRTSCSIRYASTGHRAAYAMQVPDIAQHNLAQYGASDFAYTDSGLHLSTKHTRSSIVPYSTGHSTARAWAGSSIR